jgi:uncharacterized protein (DUF924 family)
MFYHIAISHCEGPDHLQRMYLLKGVAETIIVKLPTAIAPMGQKLREQAERVTGIVEQFGRHPHRNSILGRPSTPEEEAYIATGDFPHLPKTQP